MGPLCAGIVNPRSWSSNETTLEIMRFVLVTGLFASGVELPKSYLYQHRKGMLVMVVPTMAIGWVVVAGLLKALFSRFDWVTSLVIAACLTPTDPTISAAIIGGQFAKKHVPRNIRHLITAESASNDSFAYPFISIALYLTMEPNRGKDMRDWILIGWLCTTCSGFVSKLRLIVNERKDQVVLGILIGALIGYLFSRIMKLSHKRGYLDHESYVVQCLALAVLTMGVVKTIGSDDLLAVFFAGHVIAWDGEFQSHLEGESFNTIIGYLLSCGCFFYIGAWFPWDDFSIPDLGITPWRLLVLCVGILLLRRIPAVLMLYKWVPEITNWKEALFCGHFGPVNTHMGVGAIFVSTLALHRLPEPRNPPQTQEDLLALALHPVVTFVVLVSIVVHGLSILLWNLRSIIQSKRIPPPGALDDGAGISVPSSDLSMAVTPHSPNDSSLPLHQISGVHAPQLPPLALMREEPVIH
ncbi:hypothetical protein Ac2012v2_007850 [Leucoagaricus gongylophorus]